MFITKDDLIDAMFVYTNWGRHRLWSNVTRPGLKEKFKPVNHDWKTINSYLIEFNHTITNYDFLDDNDRDIEYSSDRMNELRNKFIGFCCTDLPEKIFNGAEYERIYHIVNEIRIIKKYIK